MAAGDFSASVANDIQVKALELFDTPNTFTAEFETPVETLNVILNRQRARMVEVKAGNQCIGMKAYWVKSGVDSVTADGTSSPSFTCAVGDVTELESDEKTYADRNPIVAKVGVDDNLCNNLYELAELSAQAIKKGINDIRQALLARVITFMDDNAQTNIDDQVAEIDLGNGAWQVNGTAIEVPQVDLRNPDTLAEIDAVTQNNNLYNYFLLNGRHNFYNAGFNAQFKALNDNERSMQAQFANWNIFWDIRHLDSILSEKATFAIQPTSYVFWNRSYSQPGARLISPKDNIWEMQMTDPMLTFFNPVTGQVEPVVYEIVYEKVCDGRNTITRHRFTHKYEIKLLWGLETAPAGIQGETGFLKFTGVPAV